MYVCIIWIQAHAHTYMHAYIHMCMCTYMHTYIYLCIYIYIHIYSMYMCMWPTPRPTSKLARFHAGTKMYQHSGFRDG